ncbi:MAG: CopG family transcriptional regulator [Candidatus Wallbacteria bacterium]|nr:CopG family transcriptional regulator [Candidatus Wallbacteria bacterium]
MSDTKRTQVYLTQQSYRTMEQLARQRHSSVASVVREAVAKYLGEIDPGMIHSEDPLWNFLATEEGHQDDGAAKLDRYLYGKDHPKVPGRAKPRLRR